MLGVCSREITCLHKKLYANVHTIIPNSQEVETAIHPLTGKWINKMYSHTVE